ncbi:MAG: hypothetical protein ACREN8_13580, partial [Candidatus Dormibacteraceae bacterium]
MSLRTLQVAGLLILMVAFGAGVYLLLGALRHSGGGVENAQAPDKSRPLINLPGSIVLAQAGSLYRLQNDAFTVIASGGWTQPAVLPDHQHLLAVKRTANSSDIYLLGLDGSIQTQLTT